MQDYIKPNHIIAVLGLILALSVHLMLSELGVPAKIAWGASILSVLVVAMFWSCVVLGAEDEDD